MSFDLSVWALWAQLISLLALVPLFYAGSGFLRDRLLTSKLVMR
jgi:hypothetical protein